MTSPLSLPPEVVDTLAAVRRRRRLLALMQASAWTLLGVSLLVVTASAFFGGVEERMVSTWARRLGWVWLFASALTPALVFIVPPWLRTADRSLLARAIDDRAPTGHSLHTAVDLARRGPDSDPDTQRLADRHFEDAAAAASKVDPLAILPWSTLATARQAGTVGLVLLVVALVGLPDNARRGIDRLFAVPVHETADEEGTSADEEPVTLVLRNVSIVLTPPAYSKREALSLPGTSGDFQALPGTRVVIDADLPVSGRSARITWGDSVVAESNVNGRHVKFDFNTPAKGSGKYKVRLSRALGSKDLVTRAFRVDALPDKPPELEVVGPTTKVELRVGMTLPIEVRASDDFELRRLERVVERRGREIARFPIGDVRGRSEIVQPVRWDPAEDLKNPGGELELVIEAWDNDDVNGPKVTRSRPVEVYIPTARDQHRKVLALQEQLLGAALDLLAALLVDTAELREAAGEIVGRDAVVAKHDRHVSSADALFELASRLGEAMRRDELTKPGAFVGTGRVMDNLARRWSAVEEFVERELRNDEGPVVHPVTALGLVRLRDDAVAELEQAVLDLADFVDLDRAAGARAELADAQSNLSDLADLVRDGAEGGLVDEERLQEALQQLQQSLAEAARKLSDRRGGPDDGFLNQMPQGADQRSMDSIEKALQEGRYEDAMEMIQRMQDALAQSTDQLEAEMEGMAGSQDAAELSRALDEAIQQTKELEQRQDTLRDDTRDLETRFGSGDGIDPKGQQALVEEMEALAEEIRSVPEGIEDPGLEFRAQRWARRAEQAAEAMKDAFAEGELPEAAALGMQTRRELDIAMQGLELQARGERAVPGASGARRRASSASERAGDILEKLEAAEQRAARSRGRAAEQGEPSRRGQNGLAGDVAALRRRMEESGGSAFNPVAGRDNLRAAEDLMLRAGSGLGQGRVGRAGRAQEGALQQLRSFRESLEGARRALRQGTNPGSMAGMDRRGSQPGDQDGWGDMDSLRGDDGGEVEMPEPEDFLGPEAFRDLVLEGAQDQTPEKYKPLNGSYYEELVK